MKNITVVAHRGGINDRPENTIGAFLHSIEHGIKGIEMDVRFDHKKKRFFLEHDFFHHPIKRNNVLDDIADKLPKNIFTMVELKTFCWLTNFFVRSFLHTFNKHFLPGNTVVISFNPFALIRLKYIAGNIKRGFLCANIFWLSLFKCCLHKWMKPEIFLLHKRFLDNKNVRFAREHGMKVWGFVLNTEAEWAKAVDLGVDGITTDYPMELRDYLSRK
jgi:glycerophosphoryl diester phosphodiesterase